MAPKPRNRIQAAIDAKLGKGRARMAASGLLSTARTFLPTGVDVVDRFVIGAGGLPAGKLIEIFSEAEGAGKTSFALGCVAGAQSVGAHTAWFEAERGLEESRLPVFGVDPDKLVVVEPLHMADLLDGIDAVLDDLPVVKKGYAAKEPALIVIDSLASVPMEEELKDGLTGKQAIADRARAMSRACRVLGAKAQEKQCAILIVNQGRVKIGMSFGNSVTTPGGNAVKFHMHLRIQLMGGAAVKVGNEHVGKDITVICPKNRLYPPWRKTRVRLNYETGWDNDWTTVNFAKDRDLISAKVRSVAKARAALAKACESGKLDERWLMEWKAEEAIEVLKKLPDA